jgi:hypothetical protein
MSTQSLVGRRVYRIGLTGYKFNIETGEPDLAVYEPTDYYTIRAALPNGQVIIKDDDGRLQTIAVGDEWKLEEQSTDKEAKEYSTEEYLPTPFGVEDYPPF